MRSSSRARQSFSIARLSASLGSDQVVFESKDVPDDGRSGGVTKLRLILADSHDRVEIRIDREQQLPHKILRSVVLKVIAPPAAIEPIARTMTTITHELDRLHRAGYTLRQRAGGGLRGAWRTDLMPPNPSKATLSWESEPRKGTRLDQLACTLATIGRPPSRAQQNASGSVAELMRRVSTDTQRRQAVDGLIAEHPEMPVDDLLEIMERRGLLEAPLDPGEPELT